jgi:nitrate reductase alpha subunit
MKSRISSEKSIMTAYNRNEAILSRHFISIGMPREGVMIMYSNRIKAIPETIAENKNTIGIRTLLHQGLAFMDPKINPTYP